MLSKRLRRLFTNVVESDEWLTSKKKDFSLNLITPQRHIYAQEYDLKKIEDRSINKEFVFPPKLKHGLDKIIRTEGIYPSNQFSKHTQKMPKLTKDISARLHTYVRPSSDNLLQTIATENKAKYMSGSSSLTDALQQIYFAISNFKSPDITGLGKNYDNVNMNYMSAYKKPITFLLRKLPSGVYAIDGDKIPIATQDDILLVGGLIMESLFTIEENIFNKIIDMSKELTDTERFVVENTSKSFRYRLFGNLMVRSQIDCGSVNENGEGFVFEIKTRASAPIRYDLENYYKYLDYAINKRTGIHNSYEREYFDLVRSILLKYFFQIKIGKMDGAFIAYHNTEEVFGYEYIKIEEIEKRLFGSSEISNQVLLICMAMYQDILDDIIEKFPDDEMIKVGFYADYRNDELLITIEPHEKNFEYVKDPKILEHIEDEVDYYDVFFPGKTAYAISRRIYPYINGILQKEPVFLESGDKLTFKLTKYNKGVMNINDYMYFLHHAYKFDSITYHKDFIGTWKKFNDFHVYRKPLYRSLIQS